ncbi:MAG: chorismate synthase [Clostridiales bacterium]|nr:chorismate synthase [Clostridiales bacterium]
MSSMTGKNIKISVFGQSHSAAIGVVIDGLPAGYIVDFERVNAFMARRAPGQNVLSTPRKEADLPKVLSGIAGGATCGAPLCAVIRNGNTRSGDYSNIKDCPRPSHADYAAFVKYNGANDVAGGGHFSGRLTAPLCFAGAVCIQLLEKKGIFVKSHIYSIADEKDTPFDLVNITEEDISSKDFPVIDGEAGKRMAAKILEARSHADSVGGIIECAVTGVPAGVGDPMFDGIENIIAKNIFAIPAVKGIEFGNGFDCTRLRGSENNDPYYIDGNKITTKTNNAGGITGGITTGMPIVFRAAFKPTSSIGREQDSVSLSKMENQKLIVKGRHDPCIVQRAVPVVEAVTAFTILDALSD